MTSKRAKSSKRKTTMPSSKKKVVLMRPALDFTRPPEEQQEALDAFVHGFVRELKKARLRNL